MTCLFCNIAEGKLNASLIYQDNKIIAFDDINPQAPCHKIIIPRQHIASLNEKKEEDDVLIGQMISVAVKLAHQLNLAEEGYRLVMNCNANGGQTVFHIHLHLLGGRIMHWPPG